MSFISLFVQYLASLFQFYFDIFHQCWGIGLTAWDGWARVPDMYREYKYRYKYRYKCRHKYRHIYRNKYVENTDTNIDTNFWEIRLAAWDRWARGPDIGAAPAGCLLKAPPPAHFG